MDAKRTEFTQSDAVLRALAEGTSDVLFVRGVDGTYLMANRAAAEANGVSVDELVGRDDSLLFPPEVVRAVRADDQRVIETGETLTFTRELPVRGELRTYHTTKGPCRDAAGRILGVFVVSRDITDHVRALAERAALLERERAAREKAEAAATALEMLGRITEAALSSLQVDEVLDALVKQLRGAFAVDTVAVVLVDEQRRELSLRAGAGLDAELASGLRFPDQHGVAGRIFTERRPVIFGEHELATLRHVSPFIRDHVRAALGVPLRLHDKVLGVLHLGSVAPRAFTQEEGALLQLAADRIALALEHARLFEESVRANRARDELLGWWPTTCAARSTASCSPPTCCSATRAAAPPATPRRPRASWAPPTA